LSWCQNLYFSRPIAPLFQSLYNFALQHPNLHPKILPFIEKALINDIANLRKTLKKNQLSPSTFENAHNHLATQLNLFDSRFSPNPTRQRYLKCSREFCSIEIITVFATCSKCDSFQCLCLKCIARFCDPRHSDSITFHLIEMPTRILYLFKNFNPYPSPLPKTKCQKTSFHYSQTLNSVIPKICCNYKLHDIYTFLYTELDNSLLFQNAMLIKNNVLTFDYFSVKTALTIWAIRIWREQFILLAATYRFLLKKKKKMELPYKKVIKIPVLPNYPEYTPSNYAPPFNPTFQTFKTHILGDENLVPKTPYRLSPKKNTLTPNNN
jgi:hypothetical protein